MAGPAHKKTEDYSPMTLKDFKAKFSDHDIETTTMSVKGSELCNKKNIEVLGQENYSQMCSALYATKNGTVSISMAYPKEPGGDIHSLMTSGGKAGIYVRIEDPDGSTTRAFQKERAELDSAGPQTQTASPIDGMKVTQTFQPAHP